MRARLLDRCVAAPAQFARKIEYSRLVHREGFVCGQVPCRGVLAHSSIVEVAEVCEVGAERICPWY
jgi:hypothetical protein